MRHQKVLTLGLSIAMSTLGFSNDQQTQIFQQFDGNRDGSLTETEFTHAVMTGLFKKFDLNSDNKVTRKEFFKQAKDKQRAKSEYPKIDTSNKGYIVIQDVKNYSALDKELRANFQQILPKGQKKISLAQLKNLPASQ